MNGQTPKPSFQKPKRPISMDLLFIGVIGLLAVGSWVIFDIYRAATVTTVPRVLQRQIRPIQSEINDELLNDIRSRRQFNEQELLSVTPPAFIPLDQRGTTTTPSPSPSPELTTPDASPAATPAITPTPTESTVDTTTPPGATSPTGTETGPTDTGPPGGSGVPF